MYWIFSVNRYYHVSTFILLEINKNTFLRNYICVTFIYLVDIVAYKGVFIYFLRSSATGCTNQELRFILLFFVLSTVTKNLDYCYFNFAGGFASCADSPVMISNTGRIK
jgi:hypothetical protein